MTRSTLLRTFLLATGLLLGLAGRDASAAAIYAYQGNLFSNISDDDPPAGTYTNAMRVEGEFELAAPLGANEPLTEIGAELVGWEFRDGRNTLTEANSTTVLFEIATDGSGMISEWNIFIEQDFPTGSVGELARRILTGNIVVPQDKGQVAECVNQPNCNFQLANSTDEAFRNVAPGDWLLVPEPATALLTTLGFATLAALRRPRPSGPRP